jgi:hypothetical protein
MLSTDGISADPSARPGKPTGIILPETFLLTKTRLFIGFRTIPLRWKKAADKSNALCSSRGVSARRTKSSAKAMPGHRTPPEISAPHPSASSSPNSSSTTMSKSKWLRGSPCLPLLRIPTVPTSRPPRNIIEDASVNVDVIYCCRYSVQLSSARATEWWETESKAFPRSREARAC